VVSLTFNILRYSTTLLSFKEYNVLASLMPSSVEGKCYNKAI